jgi:PEGA domain-containing protein
MVRIGVILRFRIPQTHGVAIVDSEPRRGRGRGGAGALERTRGCVSLRTAGDSADGREPACARSTRLVAAVATTRSITADSTPDGAKAIVDGRELGQTPTLLTVECDSGRDMVVEFVKKGRRAGTERRMQRPTAQGEGEAQAEAMGRTVLPAKRPRRMMNAWPNRRGAVPRMRT